MPSTASARPTTANDRAQADRPSRARGSIRRLGAGHADEFVAHLCRLSAADRLRRFAHPVQDQAIESFVRCIDWSTCVVLGYFEGERLRAAVQIACIGGAPDDAAPELAIQVETGWQRRGIASALMRAAAAVARARGIGRFCFYALADNHPVKALFAKFGGRFRRAGTLVQGDLPLTAAA
jgi:GNAT superfamily N-acetyltransferase